MFHRSSLSYLSSYIYHQYLAENSKISKICSERPPGTNTLPLSDEMGQIPSTEGLESRWMPLRRLGKTGVVVVGHAYHYFKTTEA